MRGNMWAYDKVNSLSSVQLELQTWNHLLVRHCVEKRCDSDIAKSGAISVRCFSRQRAKRTY